MRALFEGHLSCTRVDPEDQAEQPLSRWRNPRLHAGIAIALAVATLGYLGLRPAGQRDLGPAPDLRLEPLRGSEIIGNDDLRGRPVVLNFWASWCDPCRDEMPLFEETWREHFEEGLLVVGVNVQDRADFALEFLDEVEVTYPVVTDPDKVLQDRLAITGLPVTLFIRPEEGALDAVLGGRIDEGGKLVVGEISAEELRTRVQELLGGVRASGA